MDSAASLDYNPDTMSMVKQCIYLPPLNEYSTRLTVFPAVNCIKEWGLHGSFYLTAHVYAGGEEVVTHHSTVTDQKGYLDLQFDDACGLIDDNLTGTVVVDMYHTENIPPDLYGASVHRETGAYVSYPFSMFIGDQLFSNWHTEQLENSLFWPGVVSTEDSDSCVVILNPFGTTFRYQLALYTSDGNCHMSEVQKIRPYESIVHEIEEEFPDQVGDLRANGGKSALCAMSQYKLIANFIVRDRASKIYTTVDHMHTYCMF